MNPFLIQGDDAIANGVTASGVQIDLAGIASITCLGVQFDRVVLSGFRGIATLGAGPSPSRFRDCVLRNCRFERLALGYADLLTCSFIDCEIRELVGFDATLRGCRFQGRINRGIIGISSVGQYVSRGPNRVEANDFLGCELRDLGFRGGIDLSSHLFSPTSRAGLILDARTVIADRLRGSYSEEQLTPRQRSRVRFVREYVDVYRQPDVFLGSSILKRDPPDVRALMQVLSAT